MDPNPNTHGMKRSKTNTLVMKRRTLSQRRVLFCFSAAERDIWRRMLRDNGLKISGVVLYVAGRGSGMLFSGEGEGLECRTSVSGYASAFRVLSLTIWSCACTVRRVTKGGHVMRVTCSGSDRYKQDKVATASAHRVTGSHKPVHVPTRPASQLEPPCPPFFSLAPCASESFPLSRPPFPRSSFSLPLSASLFLISSPSSRAFLPIWNPF